MDCPACKTAMITFELADVEIDHCVACGGIWLDAGELELLLDDPAGAGTLLSSFEEDRGTTEQTRKCPICERRMTKVAVGRSPTRQLIDKCRRNHGLWFDRGELPDALERGRLDPGSKIRGLLADMFGLSSRGSHKESQP